MTTKPLVALGLARRDVEDAIDHYLAEAGDAVAMRFIDALERAYRSIAEAPGTGSPRYAHELNLPSLRHWRVKRYPFYIFYMEHQDRIDIWRVLHAQRDIPAWMQ
ncbi:type II toxin-antitoxin system RelE/ParE family toxin, partial [Sphingopyxis sp.]|uniref:type II toxin-antitoxin system RelE/ParE family toxin n=1 Tax=Sphingopyxis sp. TaxID=1908224 RepID=UPI002EDA8DC8